jgi:hypothetical protein
MADLTVAAEKSMARGEGEIIQRKFASLAAKRSA